MPIRTVIEDESPDDETRDVYRFRQACEGLGPDLWGVRVYARAGHTGRWGALGYSIELYDETGEPGSIDEMIAETMRIIESHTEREGPHVYQLRFYQRGKGGDPIRAKTYDTTIQGDGMKAHSSDASESRADRHNIETTTLAQMHEMYLKMMKTTIEIAKTVTQNPIALAQVEIRKMELEAQLDAANMEIEHEDRKDMREIATSALDLFLKQAAQKSAQHPGPAPATTTDQTMPTPPPPAPTCETSTRLSQLNDSQREALARVLRAYLDRIEVSPNWQTDDAAANALHAAAQDATAARVRWHLSPVCSAVWGGRITAPQELLAYLTEQLGDEGARIGSIQLARLGLALFNDVGESPPG